MGNLIKIGQISTKLHKALGGLCFSPSCVVFDNYLWNWGKRFFPEKIRNFSKIVWYNFEIGVVSIDPSLLPW